MMSQALNRLKISEINTEGEIIAMADIMVAKQCPRRAALSTGSSNNKVGVLRSICKEVLLTADFSMGPKEVTKLVKEIFGTKTHNMLPFEERSEMLRMTDCILSYLRFEKSHRGTVVAKDFVNSVKFGVTDKSASAHILIDRGDCLECIRYKYKLQEYAVTGKTRGASLLPNNSAELLLLQRTGEAEAKKLGINKPVFGAVFYIRRKKMDKVGSMLEFEEISGSNVANYHFSDPEAAAIIKEYETVEADPAITSCDPAYCKNCMYDELCHMEFVKRTLTVNPPEPPVPINSIHMTDAQRNFVEFRKGECRVNAVAGSGKTTIIVLRTIGLLEESVPPEHILMLTFTEKAAMEMRDRLTAYASGSALSGEALDVDKVDVGTFNAWGQRIIDQYYKELGFSKKPELIDDVVKKDTIIDILKKHPNLPFDYNNPFMSTMYHQGAVMEMLQLIDAMKAAHAASVDDVYAIVGKVSLLGGHAKELLEMYNEYNMALVSKNLLDYEDQLRLLLELDAKGIFAKMPYEHIVIDEFQDSNPNQLDIVLKVAEQAPNFQSLAVVGDEMQSIYSFRNATPENLVTFNKYFPKMVDISMEDNFRSFTPIVRLANHLLDNASTLKTNIKAHKLGHGLDPVLKEIDSDEKELKLYVAQTKKLIREGTEPADICVMCRTRGELIRLRDAMAAEGIPVILRVPEVIGDSPYVKAIISLAQFLLDNDNMVALALYAKSLGLDPFDKPTLESLATEISDKMAAIADEKGKKNYFWELTEDACGDFVAANFVDALKKRKFRMLNSLLSYCVKYGKYGTKELLSTANEKANCVTLITIHSAKGLEWPVVLLSLKRFRSGIEEEKRLLYVGITRAKEKLLVTYDHKKEDLIQLLSA